MCSSMATDTSNFKNFRKTSRMLTIVENGLSAADDILKSLKIKSGIPVIGVTGPPGAGKSTLVVKLIAGFLEENKRIAVLAVDPSSPFTSGSLLGDRIRMQSYATHPNVYIRSVATRGALGGLSSKVMEMTDILRSSGYDYVLIETVGVGQSEVEIAALADITLVVLVPEAGDEVQSIKAGIMEIGDAFIVNKADREGADQFANNLKHLTQRQTTAIPVFKTVATKGDGMEEVINFIKNFKKPEAKVNLLAQKAFLLIQDRRMADINRDSLQRELNIAALAADFNIYKYVESKIKNS
ncbi:MAG: methylmalonyl Co-A mutase-associated GTPase MeaB [Pyrinomonadaceae bacterium]|nr:methylmalonyl Co-A mutase-associated GTPase MeaB [Sphingobacteriaceae bacterium]